MNKYTYTVGQRVRDRHDRTFHGEVMEVADEDDLIVIRWEGSSDSVNIDVYDVEPVDPEADKARAVRAQAFVNEAVRSLEASFEAWQSAIKEYGGDSNNDAYLMKQDDLVDLTKFEDVLEFNGWRTSSLYC